MSNKKSIDILFPPGRFVQGSLYDPNTENADGEPLVYKSGQNKGQPRVDYFIGVAIPKIPGHTHWSQTEWGAQIWAAGFEWWPGGQSSMAIRDDFAWKITDGDSTKPDKKGKRPCDKEGHPGNWIVKFGGGTQPKIVNFDGSKSILEPDAVMPGDHVQMFGSIASNESTQTAGIYVNHRIVAFVGYDNVNGRIAYGPDPSKVGFGTAPRPAGVSDIPTGALAPPAAAGAPGVPSANTASPPPPAAHAAPSTPPPPAATASTPPPPPVPGAQPTPPPNPALVAAATTAAPPPPGAAAAPPPPAAPVRQMTAAATTTYDEYIRAGWTPEALVQHGFMIG